MHLQNNDDLAAKQAVGAAERLALDSVTREPGKTREQVLQQLDEVARKIKAARRRL